MVMKPLPILHLPSVDSSGVIFYKTSVSSREANLVTMGKTYGHMVEVPFEYPRNLVGEFATVYR